MSEGEIIMKLEEMTTIRQKLAFWNDTILPQWDKIEWEPFSLEEGKGLIHSVMHQGEISWKFPESIWQKHFFDAWMEREDRNDWIYFFEIKRGKEWAMRLIDERREWQSKEMLNNPYFDSLADWKSWYEEIQKEATQQDPESVYLSKKAALDKPIIGRESYYIMLKEISKFYENLRNPTPLNQSNAVLEKLISIEQSLVDQVYTVLSSYFNADQQTVLKKALEGEKVEKKLHFSGNANQLADVFWLLTKGKCVKGTQKKVTEWICNNFTYTENGQTKEFNPGALKDVIDRTERKCANPLPETKGLISFKDQFKNVIKKAKEAVREKRN
jgi:hypothetical protein